jgi:hypothetical protein
MTFLLQCSPFLNIFYFTPLKISNRTAVETSTKLPVTDLKQAPFQGADSNLHRYKPLKNYNGTKSHYNSQGS